MPLYPDANDLQNADETSSEGVAAATEADIKERQNSDTSVTEDSSSREDTDKQLYPTNKEVQNADETSEERLFVSEVMTATEKARNEKEKYNDKKNSKKSVQQLSSSSSLEKPNLIASQTSNSASIASLNGSSRAATTSINGASLSSRAPTPSPSIPGAFRVPGISSSTTGPSSTTEPASTTNRSSSIESINENSEDITSEDNISRRDTTSSSDQITTADVEAATVASPPTLNHEVTTAYLVQDELAEVQPIQPFYKRREGKITIALVVFLLLIMAVLLGVFLGGLYKDDTEDELSPTMSPTLSPTFDPRSTLEVVQDRGFLNCGLEDVAEGGDNSFIQYNTDFCRGLAAVVFGDPEKYKKVIVGNDDRYEKLLDREVDVLYAGDAFTLEKGIREPSTGEAMAYGYSYYGAAVVYAGPAKYVQCANDQKRFGECEDLKICAVDTRDLLDLLPQYFPASFITFGPFPLMEEYLKTGICNVIASDTYRLSGSSLQKLIDTGEFVISDYYISRNLIASVVRYGDTQWYDIVEASRLARFRATQMGIYQNDTACQEIAEERSFMGTSVLSTNSLSSSPICVGNSVQTFQRSIGQTVIGFKPFIPYLSAIDAPTLGNLECDDCEDILNYGKLKEIKERGHLNCAVYLDPAHNLTRSSLATVVNDKFCKLLGVAIFQGDPDATNITYIDSMDYTEFPSEFDVVAGAGWEGKIVDSWDLTNAGSMSLTYPYFVHDKYRYNGEEYDGLGFHLSFATDNEDFTLNYLTTSVVVATVYAQREGITKDTPSDMPLIELFGDSLTFMFRDVIAYGGNYDEIINEAMAMSDKTTEIGWNTVIPNYYVAAKTPVLYCDFTGNCPPCTWIKVEGYSVCFSIGPY